MAPRLIEERRCPHCGAALPEPKPRACPECMGSLQVRYLRAGCLSSKPLLALLGLGLWQALAGEERVAEAASEPAPTLSAREPARGGPRATGGTRAVDGVPAGAARAGAGAEARPGPDARPDREAAARGDVF